MGGDANKVAELSNNKPRRKEGGEITLRVDDGTSKYAIGTVQLNKIQRPYSRIDSSPFQKRYASCFPIQTPFIGMEL